MLFTASGEMIQLSSWTEDYELITHRRWESPFANQPGGDWGQADLELSTPQLVLSNWVAGGGPDIGYPQIPWRLSCSIDIDQPFLRDLTV